jgi:hypothetical protein
MVLKIKSAVGPDEVSNAMLRQLSPLGIKYLTALYNDSWTSRNVPILWRKAIIIPILKPKKRAELITSYRPISLTSCVCKLFERLICQRLTHWLEKNNALCPEQAGFRKLRCTQQQVLRIVQRISDGFQKPKPAKRTALVLIYFRRAFDTVWRSGLINKMIDMGVPDCIIAWVRYFLAERLACVELEGTRSKYKRHLAGVPRQRPVAHSIPYFHKRYPERDPVLGRSEPVRRRPGYVVLPP